MRTRFGRRQIFEIFGGTVVVALGIGALTVIVLRMRKREAEDTSGEPREPTSERFGEDREHQTQSNIGTAEPLSNSLNAEAEKTQEDDTQDLTETVQQIVRETADEAIIQDTEETEGTAGEKIRRAKGPVRLRPLKGQPMMSVIRGSVRRSRGGA